MQIDRTNKDTPVFNYLIFILRDVLIDLLRFGRAVINKVTI